MPFQKKRKRSTVPRRDPETECLNELKVAGYEASTVSGKKTAKISFDAYGIFDLMGAAPGIVLLVQATSIHNHNARLTKMMSTPALRRLLETPVIPLLISCETSIALPRRYRVEGFRLSQGRLEHFRITTSPLYGMRLPLDLEESLEKPAASARRASQRLRKRST